MTRYSYGASRRDLTLLGPIAIDWDTAGYQGEPLNLNAPGSETDWVYAIWVVVTELFDNAFSGNFVFGRLTDDFENEGRTFIAVDNGSADPVAGRMDDNHRPFQLGPGLALYMAVDDPPGLTQGRADVYALLVK